MKKQCRREEKRKRDNSRAESVDGAAILGVSDSSFSTPLSLKAAAETAANVRWSVIDQATLRDWWAESEFRLAEGGHVRAEPAGRAECVIAD